MFYAYILHSKENNEYYVGYSSDLKKRIIDHEQNRVFTTKNKNEYKLVWYAGFSSKAKALDFEKYLKSSSGYAFRNKRLL